MHEPFGNTFGLKPSELKHLKHTWRRRTSPHELVSAELARHLTEFSRDTHRQVGVLLTRKGEVEWVVVGNAHKLELPDIGRARAGQVRLRGLRLVHTHLKSEPLTKDDLTDLALLRLDAVAAIGVKDDGLPGVLHWAHLMPQNDEGAFWRTETLANVHDEQPDLMATISALEDELARAAKGREVSGRERAVLVAVCLDRDRAASEASLHELAELARTAGVEVVEATLQVRREADPRYLIGRGKLDELNLASMQTGADVLVFDKNLSPGQARHIGEATSMKVLDRTQLILDIFAQRAQSADGKLQVELAQLKYMLPRLVQADSSLSRLMGGGVGGRGPGETKLEIDRRRVRDRITALNRRIDQLGQDRKTRRRARNRAELPVISIVGYTNAGKSTLLNALTKSEVLAEDKLFATLDPTSRRLRFPREHEVIITDTVGFIRNLPRDLVAAFRATLEELADASLLLHVVDAADPAHPQQIEAVEAILHSLDLSSTPRLLVWNKVDRMNEADASALVEQHGGVAISAATKKGLDALLEKAERTLFAETASDEARRCEAEPMVGFAQLAVALLLHQAPAEPEPAAALEPTPLQQSELALSGMRDKLRAIEHGLQEAGDLGDNRAFDCVKSGQLAIAHQVESSEQWDALLKDAVANDDAPLTRRLLRHILDAELEVSKRASELSTCRLKVEPPKPPVINRTWFFCNDAPAEAQNPAWRSCERQRGAAITFGLEGLLVAAPVGSLLALAFNNYDFGSYGALAVESAVGGLVGGVGLFIVTGGIALAVTGGLSENALARIGPAVGIATGLGVGAGQVVAMWIARPDSGNAAPIAAVVSYLAIAAVSALLIAVHDHFSVAASGDDDASLAEKSFAFAPALMAVASIVTVPAVWTHYARR